MLPFFRDRAITDLLRRALRRAGLWRLSVGFDEVRDKVRDEVTAQTSKLYTTAGTVPSPAIKQERPRVSRLL